MREIFSKLCSNVKIMKMKLTIIIGVLLFSVANVLAQGGGKAEPNRIKFAKGKSSTVLSATLSNNEEMEYVFSAKAGQKVKLKVTSVPKGNLFSFSVDGSEGVELETDYDSYSMYDFTAPTSGDYLVFVKKKAIAKVPKAKFILTLSIK